MSGFVCRDASGSIEYVEEPDEGEPTTRTYVHQRELDVARGPRARFGLIAAIGGRETNSALVCLREWLAYSRCSACLFDDRVVVACGTRIVAFGRTGLDYLWSRPVNESLAMPVFGLVRLDATSLLVHGELVIERYSCDGTLVWTVDGADVFDGELVVHDDVATITDFLGGRYTIDLMTGASRRSGPLP